MCIRDRYIHMYVSKYYTCEEIDQRLLQGYYDDSLAHGFVGTLKEFWAFFLSIANKVDKKEGWDLSENNFSDELLEKLNGIEEHANYVTKVSQLENDLKYQTQEQVEKYIHDLVDGADDALEDVYKRQLWYLMELMLLLRRLGMMVKSLIPILPRELGLHKMCIRDRCYSWR